MAYVIYYEIMELMHFLGIALVHIQREQNVLVDMMANWGVGLSSIFFDSVILNSYV